MKIWAVTLMIFLAWADAARAETAHYNSAGEITHITDIYHEGLRLKATFHDGTYIELVGGQAAFLQAIGSYLEGGRWVDPFQFIAGRALSRRLGEAFDRVQGTPAGCEHILSNCFVLTPAQVVFDGAVFWVQSHRISPAGSVWSREDPRFRDNLLGVPIDQSLTNTYRGGYPEYPLVWVKFEIQR